MSGTAARLVARLGLLTLGTVVPGAAGLTYRSLVARHPLAAAVVLAGYEAALLAVGFAAKVFGKLEPRWTERVAEAVDRRVLWRASGRVYLRQLRASVRDMETVGIATHGEFVFRMRQVYVDVSLVPQTSHNAGREPYLGAVPGGETVDGGRRRSLESVLRDAERGRVARVLALVGGPGSGKTTLARNTALALCERRRPGRRRLPVLLYLRDHARDLLADPAPPLSAVACSAGWLAGKAPADWLERRLDRGGCVVLLDGLDEVADPAERGKVVAWVAREIERHPGNTYVITSRPHGYQDNPLPRAEVLQVRRFTPRQIDLFIRRWSYAVESRARGRTGREVRTAANRGTADLLARLRARPALYDLAANPLLLTMTANVHRYRGALPGSRAELYAEMCDVLLHRRAEARGLSDATGLTGPQKQGVAQQLALAMMRARVRDWPAASAVRAVQTPLRRVPGNVSAEVFLEEARKSGLLVEREKGVYGFAHLTLQEYLAAAHLSRPRADTDVLTAGVDDPWWRETTLLWAAGNDATDVIVACLDSGTVAALALAFDCADQAGTVSPEVRERLEALLLPPEPGQAVDPARRRLLAGILATRTLRETVQIGDTVALCAQPVSRALYDLFVRDERAAGRHHPAPDRADGTADQGAPAVGVQAGDAERFAAWLRDITGDSSYRLPTPQELADPTAAVAAGRHTVWAHDGVRTTLHQPPDVPWPYASTPEQRATTALDDLLHHTAYLRLLVIPAEQRNRVEGWISVLTTALTNGSEPRSQDIVVLAIARCLSGALTHDRRVARARYLGRARHVTRTFGSDHGGGQAASRDLVLPPDADTDHIRGHIHGLLQALRLDDDRDRLTLTRALVLSDGRDRLLSPDLARALDHADNRVLDLDLARALDGALARALDRDLVLDGALNLVRAFYLDLDLARALDHDRDRVLDLARALDLVRDLDHLALDLDLVLDVALDISRGTQETMLASTAFNTLFDAWTPPTSRRKSASDAFVDYLRACPPATDRAPADPAATLGSALDLLRAAGPAPGYSRLARCRVLLEQALELLTAIRDRTHPAADRVLPLARFALLAAAKALHLDRDTAMRIHLVWLSLAAYHDAPGQPERNQILLIARTQP